MSSEPLLLQIARKRGLVSDSQAEACLGSEEGRRDPLRWLIEQGFLAPDEALVLQRLASRLTEDEGTRRECVRDGTIDPGTADELRAAQERTDPAPRTLGRYTLLREIGRGGMGVVYEAHDPQLDRRIAVKLVRNVESAGEKERLLREARLTAQLQHSGIVQVYDVGEDAGRPYLVMDFLEGENLALARASGPFGEKTCLSILAQVARAVHFAHGSGILHRDLKPENVIRTKDGRIVVMDFGLARRLGPAPSISREIVGTPSYMSPEQIAGDNEAVDARTDVWGLGAMLYFLLAGRPAFEGGSVGDIFRNVKSAPAPPIPGVTSRVQRILDRALEKDPSRRFPTALAFAEACEPARTSRAAAAIPAAVLLLALGAIGWRLNVKTPASIPPADPDGAARARFEQSIQDVSELTTQIEFKTGSTIPSNPFHARRESDVAVLARYLSDGPVAVTPAEIREGCLAIGRGATMASLVTSEPERIERAFLAKPAFASRWTWREGRLLVLVWGTRDYRKVFEQTVLAVQRRLGIAPRVPDLFPAALLFDKRSSMPADWDFAARRSAETSDKIRDLLQTRPPPAPLRSEEVLAIEQSEFAKMGGRAELEYWAVLFTDEESARRAEEAAPRSRTRFTARVGRTVVFLRLVGGRLAAFCYFRLWIRKWCGLRETEFEDFVPTPEDLPSGLSIGAVSEDKTAILRDLRCEDLARDVVRAWKGTFRPGGELYVLEVSQQTLLYSRLEEKERLRHQGTILTVVRNTEALDDLLNGWFGSNP